MARKTNEIKQDINSINEQLALVKQKRKDVAAWMNSKSPLGRRDLRAFENMKSVEFERELELRKQLEEFTNELKASKPSADNKKQESSKNEGEK